jgi:hypothetical protein
VGTNANTPALKAGHAGSASRLDSLRAQRAAQGLVVASAGRKAKPRQMAIYLGLDALIQRAEFLEDDTTYELAQPTTASLSHPLPPLETLSDDAIPF